MAVVKNLTTASVQNGRDARNLFKKMFLGD